MLEPSEQHPNDYSTESDITLLEPLGIKKPLLPPKPLGQTLLQPKFLLPLGAKPIAAFENWEASALETPDSSNQEQVFQNEPFAQREVSSDTSITSATVEPKVSPILQQQEAELPTETRNAIASLHPQDITTTSQASAVIQPRVDTEVSSIQALEVANTPVQLSSTEPKIDDTKSPIQQKATLESFTLAQANPAKKQEELPVVQPLLKAEVQETIGKTQSSFATQPSRESVDSAVEQTPPTSTPVVQAKPEAAKTTTQPLEEKPNQTIIEHQQQKQFPTPSEELINASVVEPLPLVENPLVPIASVENSWVDTPGLSGTSTSVGEAIIQRQDSQEMANEASISPAPTTPQEAAVIQPRLEIPPQAATDTTKETVALPQLAAETSAETNAIAFDKEASISSTPTASQEATVIQPRLEIPPPAATDTTAEVTQSSGIPIPSLATIEATDEIPQLTAKQTTASELSIIPQIVQAKPNNIGQELLSEDTSSVDIPVQQPPIAELTSEASKPALTNITETPHLPIQEKKQPSEPVVLKTQVEALVNSETESIPSPNLSTPSEVSSNQPRESINGIDAIAFSPIPTTQEKPKTTQPVEPSIQLSPDNELEETTSNSDLIVNTIESDSPVQHPKAFSALSEASEPPTKIYRENQPIDISIPKINQSNSTVETTVVQPFPEQEATHQSSQRQEATASTTRELVQAQSEAQPLLEASNHSEKEQAVAISRTEEIPTSSFPVSTPEESLVPKADVNHAEVLDSHSSTPLHELEPLQTKKKELLLPSLSKESEPSVELPQETSLSENLNLVQPQQENLNLASEQVGKISPDSPLTPQVEQPSLTTLGSELTASRKEQLQATSKLSETPLKLVSEPQDGSFGSNSEKPIQAVAIDTTQSEAISDLVETRSQSLTSGSLQEITNPSLQPTESFLKRDEAIRKEKDSLTIQKKSALELPSSPQDIIQPQLENQQVVALIEDSPIHQEALATEQAASSQSITQTQLETKVQSNNSDTQGDTASEVTVAQLLSEAKIPPALPTVLENISQLKPLGHSNSLGQTTVEETPTTSILTYAPTTGSSKELHPVIQRKQETLGELHSSTLDSSVDVQQAVNFSSPLNLQESEQDVISHLSKGGEITTSWSSIAELLDQSTLDNTALPDVQPHLEAKKSVASQQSVIQRRQDNEHSKDKAKELVFTPEGLRQADEVSSDRISSSSSQPKTGNSIIQPKKRDQKSLKHASSSSDSNPIIPIDQDSTAAITVSTNNSKPDNNSYNLETLAHEIYKLLQQRLEIERERHGRNYSGRLP